jgi:hypothetical protein
MATRPAIRRWGHDTAVASGKALEGLFAAVAHVRPADKPLHPRGRLHSAVIERTGTRDAVGVPFIDEPGTSTGIVRLSRATGLPAALPDIHGLALRVPLQSGAHADLLFATTGLGRWSRFVLLPSQHAGQRSYSTLLPYRTSSGPVTLAAVPVHHDERTFDLACATVGGAWQTFARMELSASDSAGSPSFDPVLNQLPGLRYYEWVADLREGAYRAARRSRTDHANRTGDVT